MSAALREAAQQALEAWNTGDLRVLGPAMGALRVALAQEQAVTADMRSAVRFAPSSAYWSERLREFFGPDAREGIDALERRLAEAQELEGGGNLPPPLQAEPDISRCPQCNGPADNGHDRSIPPSPYLCTKCMGEPLNLRDPAVQRRLAAQWGYVPAEQAEPVQEPVAWMSDSDVGFDKSEFGATPTVPLYTAPPQRTMVPLTDEEIERIGMTSQSLRQVARAIEKASWEKNHGQA